MGRPVALTREKGHTVLRLVSSVQSKIVFVYVHTAIAFDVVDVLVLEGVGEEIGVLRPFSTRLFESLYSHMYRA